MKTISILPLLLVLALSTPSRSTELQEDQRRVDHSAPITIGEYCNQLNEVASPEDPYHLYDTATMSEVIIQTRSQTSDGVSYFIYQRVDGVDPERPMPGLDDADAKLDKPEQENAPLMMFGVSNKTKGYEPIKGKEKNHLDHSINGSSDFFYQRFKEQKTSEKNNNSYQDAGHLKNGSDQVTIKIKAPEDLVEILNGDKRKNNHMIFVDQDDNLASRERTCFDFFLCCIKEQELIDAHTTIKKYIQQGFIKDQNDKTQVDQKSHTSELDNEILNEILNKILNEFDNYFKSHPLKNKNLYEFFKEKRIIVEKEMDDFSLKNTLQNLTRRDKENINSFDLYKYNPEKNENDYTQSNNKNNDTDKDNKSEFNANQKNLSELDQVVSKCKKLEKLDLNIKPFQREVPLTFVKKEDFFTEKTRLIPANNEANNSSHSTAIYSHNVKELYSAAKSFAKTLNKDDDTKYALSHFNRITKKLTISTSKLYIKISQHKDNIFGTMFENKIKNQRTISSEEVEEYVKKKLSYN
jgi:hypothetical protein